MLLDGEKGSSRAAKKISRQILEILKTQGEVFELRVRIGA
jgi:hypothetical protein